MATQTTTPAKAETAEQQFGRLLAQWHRETDHLSSTTAMVNHPAYQAIIAMGNDAVPFLLREMESNKDGHLARALKAILGVPSPVPKGDKGYIDRVAECWVRWAKENGLRW